MKICFVLVFLLFNYCIRAVPLNNFTFVLVPKECESNFDWDLSKEWKLHPEKAQGQVSHFTE